MNEVIVNGKRFKITKRYIQICVLKNGNSYPVEFNEENEIDTKCEEIVEEKIFLENISDLDFLKWLYERIQYVYKENINVDFMLKFKEILQKIDINFHNYKNKSSPLFYAKIEIYDSEANHSQNIYFEDKESYDEFIGRDEKRIKELETFAENKENTVKGLKSKLKENDKHIQSLIEKHQAAFIEENDQKIKAQDRAKYWEDEYHLVNEKAEYYQKELEKAHTLLGRVVHQLSERWDTVNLTKYFPTDNLHHKRTVNNPSGKIFKEKV
jgi:hypothetical protein